MKEFAKKFYKSKAWSNCRRAYISKRLQIDGGLCEECKQEQGYIVHHKILLTQENIDNPAVTLNHSLLEYVCKDCHDKFDGHGFNSKPLLCGFDEDGQPIDGRKI